MVLFGGDSMANPKIVMVPLEKIDRPSSVARDLIDPQKIIELAESIRSEGLLEPIILRPMNGRYEIIGGDRRYLAHQHLKATNIAAIIKEMDDQTATVCRAVENLQRVDLSPMEEARSYHEMKTKGAMSVNEICRRTGKMKPTVLRYLRLYEMPPEFQEAVEKHGVALAVAEELMKIDDENMRSYYIKLAAENGITLRVAEMWVSDHLRSQQGKLFEDNPSQGEYNLSFESKPVFVTCQCCYGPVEVKEARNIIICPTCASTIRMKHPKTGIA
jgi:ParB family chromosome partitioning protein